ncbi:MAG: sigma-70 family RNA polymerase sigma factor [Deltaproteobacteria bacterium]|nr:sigma-70 family RNA polymerase sigma factor [Deltaproteobacteria bacterium]
MELLKAQPDDLTLVRRCQEGDQGAFRSLMERYQKKAFAQALGMLKDKDEAMDVAQEAFVKVYRYLDHFKGDSSFYTWLYRIVANLCVDRIRRKASAQSPDNVEFDEKMEQEELATAGILSTRLGTNPQKAALRAELAQKIDEALEQIPEKHREILVMRELEGMSYEDLSRVLKIPKGTVMSRLFHARAKMQKLLTDYLGHGAAVEGLGEE